MPEQFRIYKNLHNAMWSVQHFVPSPTTGKNTWLLFGHYDEFILYDCKFIVWEGTRQTVLKKQQKIVHAFVQGSDGGNITLSDMNHNRDIIKRHGVKLTYNPYKSDSFHTIDSMEPLEKASAVHFPIVGRPTVLL